MKRKLFIGLFCVMATWLGAADIELPAPKTTGGMPLMEALKNRQTQRQFSKRELSLETLSNLLWAANGVNRADGRRTAPTAMNRQELTLYVCIPQGTFRYDAAANKLVQLSSERTGDAPVMVAIVADLNKQKLEYAEVDAGFVGQNLYLFCASEKLATVFRGRFDPAAYAPLLNLPENHRMLYVQAVGYPDEAE